VDGSNICLRINGKHVQEQNALPDTQEVLILSY